MVVKIDNKLQRYGLIERLRKTFGFKIPIDAELTFLKRRVEIDVIGIDSLLSGRDPEYNWRECTYQGRRVTLCEYVGEKFGEEIRETLEALL